MNGPAALSGPRWRAARFVCLPLLLYILVAATVSAQTQPRPGFLDEPVRVVLPESYREGREYPLVVFLPYTGGSAETFHDRLAREAVLPEAIMLFPAGTPTRDDYLPDFWSFILWYEERLMPEIERVRASYAIDDDAVVLAGFSLGGDLAWALGMRNPEIFSGAVMAGTRTSYPPNDAALATMRERGYRAALIIGTQELPARIDGIRMARSTLDGASVTHRYAEFAGGHSWGGSADFVGHLRWALGAEDRKSSRTTS